MEELFHVILGVLHNLFFYQDEMEESTTFNDTIRGKMALDLCLVLKSQSSNEEEENQHLELEIVRVLGNLTRNTTARKQFCEAHGIDLILELLERIQLLIDHDQNNDFKACIIGILINVLGDTDNRLPFGQSKGVDILMNVLRDALVSYPDQQDWFLASIVCQAYWNLYNDSIHFNALCSMNNQMDELIELLMKYIDEEKIMDGEESNALSSSSSSLNPQERLQIWQSFTIVATDLLEHLQTFLLSRSSLPRNRAATEISETQSKDIKRTLLE